MGELREPIDALLRLRTVSGQLAAALPQRTGARAQRKLKAELRGLGLEMAQAAAALPETPPRRNTQLVLAWLEARVRSKSLNYVHNFLDDIVALVRLAGERDLIQFLEQAGAPEAICPPDWKRTTLNRYFSSARALYQFAIQSKSWKRLPAALKERPPRQLDDRYVLTPEAFSELLAAVRLPGLEAGSQELLFALLVVCALTGLRVSEALGLALGDVWITDRITVMVSYGKGGKTRWVESQDPLPAFVLARLRAFWLRRWQAASRDRDWPAAAWFFEDRLAGKPGRKGDQDQPPDSQQARRKLEALGFEEGPHTFRRFFANHLRARGTPLLDLINLLGHSTVQTAAQNYIQIYPNLQREQLQAWLDESPEYAGHNETLSLAELAAAQGMTREGVIKLLARQQEALDLGTPKDQRRAELKLDEAVGLITGRIARTGLKKDPKC